MTKKMLARYPIGNPRRKWRQDNFILSLVQPGPMGLEKGGPIDCEKARRGMQTAADAGFNTVELCWASPEIGVEMVRAAERLGMPLIYQNLNRFGGMGFRREKNLRPEDCDFEGVLCDVVPWRSICGIYLYDEPITPEQRAHVREMIERIEEVCPDKLPFVCSDAGNIEALVDEVDPAQVAFDQYAFGGWAGNGMTPETQMDGCFRYWSRMELARNAAKRIDAPFWFIFQGHQLRYKPCFDRYTFTASRMMANAALLYGAKELSCYVECDGVLDPETGGRGFWFEEHRKLNREITVLGNTLMALECQRVIHDESVASEEQGPAQKEEAGALATFGGPTHLAFPTMEDSELLTGKLPHRISISEMKDLYGNDYLMVLNRDYRSPVRYELQMKEVRRVWRVSDEDGSQRLAFDGTGDRIPGTLSAGSVALYRLQPMEEEPCAIEYYLDKGTLLG